MVRAMLAVSTPGQSIPDSHRHWVPLALSALLHGLLALVWMGFPGAEHHAPAENVIQVELAPPPAPPAPPAPLPAPPARQQVAADPGAPIPQLEEGILAARSSTPKVKSQDGAVAPPDPRAEPKPKPRKPEPVTQNERDFVLSQVLRHWKPPSELSAYEKADVRVTVKVGADGYFLDLYDARRPWNPASVFDGYASLSPQDVQRRTIDAFLRAIRQAQPVRLPPALQAKAPFAVRLDFRFRDAR